MFRPRLLSAAVVLVALCAFVLVAAVPRASAVEPYPMGLRTMLTTHFALYYNSDPASADFITQQQVTDMAGWAERAYTLYVNWGYPAPPPGSIVNPGHIDINIKALLGYDGNAVPGNPAAATTPGAIELLNNTSPGHTTFHEVAHVVFNVFEFAIWQPADLWLKQAAAEWAAFRAEDFLTPVQDSLGGTDFTDNTTDCVGGECGVVAYDRAGDPGWTFMEYLSERYGPATIMQLFTDGAALGLPAQPSTQYVSDVLATKGTTFDAAFSDYTQTRLAGNWAILAIKGLMPAAQTSVFAGTVSGPLPTTHISVSHFAARFLALKHRDVVVNDTGTCYAATLALSVTFPSGINAKPYYYANTLGATAQAFSVSGSVATLTVPWNTCQASPDAYVSLPNPSTNVNDNGEDFVVNGTLTVDLSTPTAATPPPDALFTGPTVAAPTGDAAPLISLYGAEVVQVSTVDRMIRLIVYSTGDGSLQASAGTTNLGTYQLRAGNNDVRFKLPQSLVNALRKPAGAQGASSSILTLKTLSPAGVPGLSVSRKITVFEPLAVKQAAAKKVAAKKAAAKKKAAAHKKAASKH